MEDVVIGAMVMVFSKEHIMNTAVTDTNIQHPTPIDAPAGHGVPGQQIRVKFYPGLGYAPCINLETLNGENHLKAG